MSLPSIDIAQLPEFADASGVFGSVSDPAMALSDDRVVVMMVYVYSAVV